MGLSRLSPYAVLTSMSKFKNEEKGRLEEFGIKYSTYAWHRKVKRCVQCGKVVVMRDRRVCYSCFNSNTSLARFSK